MGAQFIYAANVKELEGKQGIIKPDADGYYTQLVGAFNVYNSAGEFYDFTGKVASIFDKSSYFMKRVAEGKLYGEADHPAIDPFLGMQNYMSLWASRLREIRAANISHHFSKFWLEDLPNQERGQTVVGVYAKVKPKDERLLETYANPNENPCYSVRALCNTTTQGMQRFKEVTEIVTFDWVTAGGISYASKYKTPTMESEVHYGDSDMSIDITPAIMKGMESIEFQQAEMACESEIVIPVTRIRDVTGWREVPTLDLGVKERTSRKWSL